MPNIIARGARPAARQGRVGGLWGAAAHPYHAPMAEGTLKHRGIVRIRAGRAEAVEDPVAVEAAVTLYVNDIEVATLLCTPTDLEDLGVGFLLGEGVLNKADPLRGAAWDPARGTLRLQVADGTDLSVFAAGRPGTVTSGCGKGHTYAFLRDGAGLPPVPGGGSVAAATLSERMREFAHRSTTYRDTGGVHSCLFWNGREGSGERTLFREDLGRHNAVDKVLGACLREGIDPAGGVLFISGRISSEIALKCARARIPVVASRNAPTTLSASLAELLEVTLVGFVRGDRMNVYTHPGRVVTAAAARPAGPGSGR